jgi:hypothetical protein
LIRHREWRIDFYARGGESIQILAAQGVETRNSDSTQRQQQLAMRRCSTGQPRLSAQATHNSGTKPQITAIGNLSRWAFLLTFAGVGLRTNLKELGKQGARPFLVGAIGEIAIAVLTLGLIFGATQIFQL